MQAIAAPILDNEIYQIDKQAAQRAAWLVEPTDYGKDLPPDGRSLFDFLVARSAENKSAMRQYDIPFPFTALLEKLRQQLNDPNDIKQVLIPLGRSLQRSAAGLDFFSFPRAVVAVDGQPAATNGDAGLFLKDRLYIGYQEKANVLEVISYNEAAARFEFQLVKDYQAGKTPKVFYANRKVCLSCHQNAAPIFSRPLWNETNANKIVADKLQAGGKDYYGFPVAIGIDIPNAIDNATDRANGFSSQQWLWQQGCGDTSIENSDTATACRAQLFKSILQFRLSGDRGFDNTSLQYKTQFYKAVQYNWQQAWPNGVLIPSPDIPDRNPLPVSALLPDKIENHESLLRNQLHVPAMDEPLKPREPLHYYQKLNPEIAGEWISGLSGFIAEQDIQALDAHLSRQWPGNMLQQWQYNGQCDFQMRNKTAQTRISFTCQTPDIADMSQATGSFSLREKDRMRGPKTINVLKGRVYLEGERAIKGSIDKLSLSDNLELNHLTVEGQLQSSTGQQQLQLTVYNRRLHARNINGNAIQSLNMQWPTGNTNDWKNAAFTGNATVTVVNDFANVNQAVEDLLQDTLKNNTNALSDKPFRRAAVMPALFERLDMAAKTWCCLDDAGMPQPVLDSDKPVEAVIKENNTQTNLVQHFLHYCGECHRSRETFPPNFLAGDDLQIKTQLTECADRLYFRLAMWQLPAEQRSKTPMPPVHALTTMGIEESDWLDDEALRNMQNDLVMLVKENNGTIPEKQILLSQAYESLPQCLKSAVGH